MPDKLRIFFFFTATALQLLNHQINAFALPKQSNPSASLTKFENNFNSWNNKNNRSSVANTFQKMALKDVDMTPEERDIALEKATKAMTAFSNKYLENTCTKYCSDKSIPAVVIKGLAEHKVSLGAPLCPCRFYEDKEKEAKDGFWNCPCVPMRERHECHCMLFLTEDDAFAGEETNISYEEVIEMSSGMGSMSM